MEWKPKWSGRSWNNVEERPRGGGGGGRKNQPSNNEGQDSDGRKSCPDYICLWEIYNEVQAGRPDEEKEEFWGLLDDTVSAIPALEGLIIGGDLNGQVGTERGGYEEVMGIYGFGDRNREGEYILDFCLAKGLRIMKTMFKKERKKR